MKAVKAKIQELVVLTNSFCGHPALLSKTDLGGKKKKKTLLISLKHPVKTETRGIKAFSPSFKGEMKSYLPFWVELDVRCA